MADVIEDIDQPPDMNSFLKLGQTLIATFLLLQVFVLISCSPVLAGKIVFLFEHPQILVIVFQMG
jgi:hypothetical protein